MRIFIDANVLLDIALARAGLCDASAKALTKCSREGNDAFVAWHTVSNVYYVLRSRAGHESAIQFLEDLLAWVHVSYVGHTEARRAVGLGMRDFEDALQVSAAVACSADIILTRNVDDFRASPIEVQTPDAFIAFSH